VLLLPVNVTATTVQLLVTAAKGPPRLRLFAVPDPQASTCRVLVGDFGCFLVLVSPHVCISVLIGACGC